MVISVKGNIKGFLKEKGAVQTTPLRTLIITDVEDI